MAVITTCSDFGAPKNKVWHCFPIYFPWSHGPDAMLVLSVCLIGLVVFCEVGIQLTFPYGYQIAPVGWFFCPFSWKCPFWVYLLKSFLKMPSIKCFRSFLICRAPQRHVSISVSFLCISPLPVSSIHKYPQRVLCSEPCMFLWEQRMWAWRRVWVHSDHVTMLSNPNIKSGWDLLRQGLCFILLVSGYAERCWWIGTWISGSSSVEIYP